MNTDACNIDLVQEKLKGVKLTPEHPTKTVTFDDGSSVTVTVTDLATTEPGRYIKSVAYVISYGPLSLTYSIGADWSTVSLDRVSLNDYWDDALADVNFSITRFPPKAGSTYGSYVKVWGSIWYEISYFANMKHFEFKGYPDGSCEMYPISGYTGNPIM